MPTSSTNRQILRGNIPSFHRCLYTFDFCYNIVYWETHTVSPYHQHVPIHAHTHDDTTAEWSNTQGYAKRYLLVSQLHAYEYIHMTANHARRM